MSEYRLVSYNISNTDSKGSKYLQFKLFLYCLFYAIIAYILSELITHQIAPFIILMVLLGFIFITIIYFSFKKQAEKITIENDYIKIHYSNVWGKVQKRKIAYKGLKYNYTKDSKLNFLSPRTLKIYPKKERRITFETGYGGWKRSDIQDIAKMLVTRGVYNHYKFDSSIRNIGKH